MEISDISVLIKNVWIWLKRMAIAELISNILTGDRCEVFNLSHANHPPGKPKGVRIESLDWCSQLENFPELSEQWSATSV